MRDKLTDRKGSLLHGVLMSRPQQLLGEKYTQSLILQATPITGREVSRIPAFPNVPPQLPLSTHCSVERLSVPLVIDLTGNCAGYRFSGLLREVIRGLPRKK